MKDEGLPVDVDSDLVSVLEYICGPAVLLFSACVSGWNRIWDAACLSVCSVLRIVIV